MTSEDESVVLLQRWKAGDETAAEEIFSRYVSRLAGLARSRLSDKMQRRIDPDDVIQSVYRSFFHHAKNDRYELKRSGDLWRLLAGITINKTMGQVEFHRAAKRSIDGEGDFPTDGSSALVSPIAISRDPTVDEAAALTEEIETFMTLLDTVQRKVLELRLQDKSTSEIAEEIECSPRTVRRILERVKANLADKFTSLTDHE